MKPLMIGILLMAVAILLALLATTEELERFDRRYEVSGEIDLSDERAFLASRGAVESRVRITSDERLYVTVTNGGQSAYMYTNDLELSYVPETISVGDTAYYECTIVASAGKPYLLLSIPALICSLLGFAVLFSSMAKRLGKKE